MSGLEFFLNFKVVQSDLFPLWGARHYAEVLEAVYGEVDFLGVVSSFAVTLLLNIQEPVIHIFNKIFDQLGFSVVFPAIPNPHPSVIEIDGVFVLGFGNHAETGL